MLMKRMKQFFSVVALALSLMCVVTGTVLAGDALPPPLGPILPPDYSDPPVATPHPEPPAHPEFGMDPCGRAAARQWQAHLQRAARLFGPSPAYYAYLMEQAERCRQAQQEPVVDLPVEILPSPFCLPSGHLPLNYRWVRPVPCP